MVNDISGEQAALRADGLSLRELLDGLLTAAREPDFDVDSSCRDEILQRFGEHNGDGDVRAQVLAEVEKLRLLVSLYMPAFGDVRSDAFAGFTRIEALMRGERS